MPGRVQEQGPFNVPHGRLPARLSIQFVCGASQLAASRSALYGRTWNMSLTRSSHLGLYVCRYIFFYFATVINPYPPFDFGWVKSEKRGSSKGNPIFSHWKRLNGTKGSRGADLPAKDQKLHDVRIQWRNLNRQFAQLQANNREWS